MTVDENSGNRSLTAPDLKDILGAVVIGRNEGVRLDYSLRSIKPWAERVVYVDSASTDDSVKVARQHGVHVLELSTGSRMTAARGRAEGTRWLLERWPDTPFIFYVDGDCEVDPKFPTVALKTLREESSLAVVCGRRREVNREFSTYHRLIDREWDTPIGEVESCGGDAVMRAEAMVAVGGYDPTVVAGEEPELCWRLRRAGWRIWRIDAEMTRHDAAMARFGQWWRREIRSGFGSLDVWQRTGGGRSGLFAPMVRRAALWGIVVPFLVTIVCTLLLIIGAPLWAAAVFAVGLLLYTLSGVKMTIRLLHDGFDLKDALIGGWICVSSKWAQALGHIKWWRERPSHRSIAEVNRVTN